MYTSLRTFALLTASALALLATGQAAQAQQRIWPPSQCQTVHIPRLGFSSYFNGYGEHVTSVIPGSLAWNIGLEPGDTIVAVNGTRLTYEGAWYEVVAQAAYQGHLTLAIRDWRSGRVVYRHVDFGNGPPSTPKRQ